MNEVLAPHLSEPATLSRYDAARLALAEAKRVDEVLAIKDEAERMRLYARQAQDRGLIADANELQMRASRKLGQLLRAAKDAGQISQGGRPKTGSEAEQVSARVTLSEIGVDRKLSMIAQKMAEIDELAFEVRIETAREKIISTGAALVNPVKDISTAQKKDRRAEREAKLGARQRALPQKKYGVILADPEWRFEVYSRETGLDRSPDNHYPTSSLEAIKARDVASIAADDCVLFLWVTVPHLDQGLDVLKAWGFAYKSHYCWIKDQIGTGYWSRNKHELLLVGTVGNVPAPAPGTQWASAIEAPVGAHSAKPNVFHALIESFFPTLPRIELNAREARPGWDVWGNEAPETAEKMETACAPVVPDTGDGNGLRLKGNVATLARPGVGARESDTLAEDLGTTQCEDGASPAPSPAPSLIAALELREAYEGEVALIAHRKGELTMATAEKAMRAGYAALVPLPIMVQDLGHPHGTLASWANTLGLTNVGRMVAHQFGGQQ